MHNNFPGTRWLQACAHIPSLLCSALLPWLPQERTKTVRKAAKRLAQTLQMTKFAMAPMVAVAAKVSGAALRLPGVWL